MKKNNRAIKILSKRNFPIRKMRGTRNERVIMPILASHH